MKVQCSGCKSNYNIRDEKIPATGARFKCKKCQKIVEVAKPAIIHDIPAPPLSPKKMMPETGRSRSELSRNSKGKVSKTWAIMCTTVFGIVALCLALGIPIKNEKKCDIVKTPKIVMPFNFAEDKFAEFKIFIATIEQKWRVHPADLLNFQEYPAPDEYGHSQYGIEDNDVFVEFFFFFNQLFQSTIHTQDPEEAERWIAYLDSIYGEKRPEGDFYIWRSDDVNISYTYESDRNSFDFIHTETFFERQKFRIEVDSKLVKYEVFKKIVDDEMDWAVNPDDLPNISLNQKSDLHEWAEYSDDGTTNLYYKFFQDRLCRVDILVTDSEQANEMYGILKNQLGRGEIDFDESVTWTAGGLTIKTFSYLKGKGFAFTHNETLKAKEEYAKNIKSPQKKIALKERRKKEAKSTSGSDGPKKTMRKDKVDDSLKRIAGHRPQAPHRYKFSSKSRRSMTRGQKRVSVDSSNNCYSQKTECLSHCAQARKLGPRTKMYKGQVRSCSAVCYEAYWDCSGR